MVRTALRNVVRLRPLPEPLPRVLAEFSTEPAEGEATPARWTRLRITETSPGHYLCEKTRGPEPIQHRRAEVTNFESAKAFFGGGWIVKELFAMLDPARFPRWS